MRPKEGHWEAVSLTRVPEGPSDAFAQVSSTRSTGHSFPPQLLLLTPVPSTYSLLCAPTAVSPAPVSLKAQLKCHLSGPLSGPPQPLLRARALVHHSTLHAVRGWTAPAPPHAPRPFPAGTGCAGGGWAQTGAAGQPEPAPCFVASCWQAALHIPWRGPLTLRALFLGGEDPQNLVGLAGDCHVRNPRGQHPGEGNQDLNLDGSRPFARRGREWKAWTWELTHLAAVSVSATDLPGDRGQVADFSDPLFPQ